MKREDGTKDETTAHPKADSGPHHRRGVMRCTHRGKRHRPTQCRPNSPGHSAAQPIGGDAAESTHFPHPGCPSQRLDADHYESTRAEQSQPIPTAGATLWECRPRVARHAGRSSAKGLGRCSRSDRRLHETAGRRTALLRSCRQHPLLTTISVTSCCTESSRRCDHRPFQRPACTRTQSCCRRI